MLDTLRQRNFALLWLAGLISYIGDWVLIAALPVYLFERTGSTLASGLIWIVYPLSGLLFGSLAGVFVDRWDRRQTMVAVNLLQAALMPCLLFGVQTGALWVLYVVAFVEGVLSNFMTPAEGALLPRLVGEERLLTANALNSLNDNLARIAGPAIGGLLLANVGLSGAVLVDAASYLAAALLIALIAVHGSAARGGEPRESTIGFSTVWGEWVDGLRLIRGDQVLRALLLVTAVSVLADSLITPLLVPYVLDVVAGGAALFGVFLAVRGLSGVLGGVVVARFGQQLAPPRLLGWSLVAIGVGFLVIANVPLIAVVLGVLLALGPAIVGWLSSHQALVQTATEDQYRGRVLGTVSTTSSLMSLIGIGASSLLGETIGIVPIFNLAGLLYAAAGALALILFRSFLQSRVDSPAAA